MPMPALAIAFTVAVALGPEAPQDRVPGPPVTIDVVAVDNKGNPVTDLKAEDLEVWVGGYRIPIESFEARTADRRSITVIIDDVTLTPVGLGRAKEAAHKLLSRLGAGDQMAILPLSGGAATPGDNVVALRRRIDSISIPAAAFMRREDLSAHVLGTLATVSRQVAEAPAPRRIIVAIGAPWLFDTPLPPPSGGRDVGREWEDAVRAMASANVSLYVIDPGGVGMSPLPGGRNGFARDMGGMAFTNTNDVSAAVSRIMRESVTSYAIGFADPPVFRKSPIREMEVKTKRRGVTILARRYLAGGTSQP